MQIEEHEALEWASRVIVHNDRMQEELCEMLHASSRRIVQLGLFDYLTDWCPKDGEERLPYEPVIIAGNLARKKAGYIYCLPSDQRFNLFGTNLEDGYQKANVSYQGSFSAEELPSHLDVYVAPISKDVRTKAFEITQLLRKNGFKTDVDLNGKKFKKLMNHADRIKVEKMVIIGANDLAEGNVTVKNMVSGEQEAVAIDNVIDYLKGE